jgi:hypothetical protein
MNKYLLAVVGLIAAILLAITLKVPSFVGQGATVPCSIMAKVEDANVVTPVCSMRTSLGGSHETMIVSGSGQFKLSNNTAVPIDLSAQIISSPPCGFMLLNADQKNIWSSSQTGTGWSGATRAFMTTLRPGDLRFLKLNQCGPVEIMSLPQGAGALVQSSAIVVSFLVLLNALLIYFYVQNGCGKNYSDLLLCAGFAVTLIVCAGMPFGSSSGAIDSGDDLSYMHWAYAIGFLHNPDLTLYPSIKSWALNHNHHSWGTGLIMSPFVSLARLFLPKSTGPGSLHFALMNFATVFVSLLGTWIFYSAFRRLVRPWVALLVCCAMIPSSSLLKWVFMRNVFTHGPEFFCISMFTYAMVRRYFPKDADRPWSLIRVLLPLMLLAQVRREDLAFFGLPIWFEWFYGPAKTNHRNQAKAWGGIVQAAVCLILAVVILQMTNYFTELKTYFGNSRTHLEFVHENYLDAFQKVFPLHIWAKGSGFFAWPNLAHWIAPLALFLNRKSWRIWVPLSGMVCFYILLFTFHLYPTGVEWQNRFLCKLVPVMFLGVGLVIDWGLSEKGPKIAIGWLGVLGVLGGIWGQWPLYLRQLPPGMAFYLNDFNDLSLLYRQARSPLSMMVFYLPALVSLGVLGGLILLLLNRLRVQKSVAA